MSYRTEKFCRRVDEHLAAMPLRRHRIAFLADLIETWQDAYARFVAADGEIGPPTVDPPNTVDYLLTINELASRLEAERHAGTVP